MPVFSLVHGAFHGAWCWDLVAAELEARGHRCVAADLPIDDPDAGLLRHRDTVLESVASVNDSELIVVGHSLGGLVAPLVAATRAVRRVVFLNAPIPVPGVSLAEQRRAEPDMMLGALEPHVAVGDDGLRRLQPSAASAIYVGCPPRVSEEAPARWRAQNSRGMTDPCPLAAWPEVDCRYILAAEDDQVAPAWSRRAARDRLGVDAIEIPGRHYPMLSHPGILAQRLDEIAS